MCEKKKAKSNVHVQQVKKVCHQIQQSLEVNSNSELALQNLETFENIPSNEEELFENGTKTLDNELARTFLSIANGEHLIFCGHPGKFLKMIKWKDELQKDQIKFENLFFCCPKPFEEYFLSLEMA